MVFGSLGRMMGGGASSFAGYLGKGLSSVGEHLSGAGSSLAQRAVPPAIIETRSGDKKDQMRMFGAAASLAIAKKGMGAGGGKGKATSKPGGPTPGVPPAIALENLEVDAGEGLGTGTPAAGGTESISVTKEEKSLWDQLAQYMNQDIQTSLLGILKMGGPSDEGGFLRRILRNATFGLTGFPLHEWDTIGGLKQNMWNSLTSEDNKNGS